LDRAKMAISIHFVSLAMISVYQRLTNPFQSLRLSAFA
jgi:hypothetical protein